SRRSVRMSEAEAVVEPILEAVRERGDAALVEYARKFDGLEGDTVRVAPEHLRQAAEAVDDSLREAVTVASEQIRAYAKHQLPQEWSEEIGGTRLGQIVRPLESIGAYIPGGRYPLPSTLMMTVIPAQEAGVKTVSAASPAMSPATLG